MNKYKDYMAPSVLEAFQDLSTALMSNYRIGGTIEVVLPQVTFERFVYDQYYTANEEERQRMARTVTEATLNMPHGRLLIKKSKTEGE